MKKTLFSAALFLVALLLPLVGGDCQSDKRKMADQSFDGRMSCSQCYDQVQKARSAGGPREGLANKRSISTHMCDGCKTEMSIYIENNVLMAECATCAPERVACDKCLPPTACDAPNR